MHAKTILRFLSRYSLLTILSAFTYYGKWKKYKSASPQELGTLITLDIIWVSRIQKENLETEFVFKSKYEGKYLDSGSMHEMLNRFIIGKIPLGYIVQKI